MRTKHLPRRLARLIFCLLIGFAAQVAIALPLTFTKIADTSTPTPAGSGVTFGSFGVPAVDGSNVAFQATSATPSSITGIYTNIGGLSRVADSSMSTPGATGLTFSGFGNPSLAGANVAFRATSVGPPPPPGMPPMPTTRNGIYTNIGGLTPVADSATGTPGAAGFTFSSFSNPSLAGANVAFQATSIGPPIPGPFPMPSSRIGIYTSIGGLAPVVEQGAATPGAPGFALSGFGNPSLAGGNVAFQATSFESGPPGPMPPAVRSGIYTDIGGGLARVVDTGIATPGAPGFAFSGFGNPSLAGGNVAFQAMRVQAGPPGPMPPPMRSGIYTDIGGLTLVADAGAATPGAPGFTFVGFGDPSLAGDDVAFRAASTRPAPPGPIPPIPTMVEGLYIEINGILEKILDTNDLLDGKAIASFAFGPEGFDGDSLAFVVSFRDFSFAVYRADIASVSVPIPGTLALIGAALAAMWTARRRGRGFWRERKPSESSRSVSARPEARARQPLRRMVGLSGLP